MKVDWKILLGGAVTVFLLWWLFRNEDPVEIWTIIRSANLPLLLLSIAITTAGFLVRAIRWRLFLEPVLPGNKLRPRFASVTIGFMVNNLFVARVGEFARAYAYSRMEPVTAPAAFATLVVERFLDGFAVLALLFIAIASPSFPSGDLHPLVADGITGVSIALGVLLAAFVALVVSPEATSRVLIGGARRLIPGKWMGTIERGLTGFLEGLGSLRSLPLLLKATAWSLGFWAFHSLSFWVGLFAFGIELPYAAALFMNATIAFAVSIPSTPGFFGTFHAGAVIALVDVYGVGQAESLGFAVGWHLGAFVPVTAIGLWYASRIGLSLSEVRGPQSEDGASEAPEGSGSGASSGSGD